jgi:hypothetical protein
LTNKIKAVEKGQPTVDVQCPRSRDTSHIDICEVLIERTNVRYVTFNFQSRRDQPDQFQSTINGTNLFGPPFIDFTPNIFVLLKK